MPALPAHICPHHSLCFHTHASYSPYPPAAPSRYTSNAALNPPFASSHPPNALFHLPCLCLHSALRTCLRRHPHTGLILNAVYHPYALAAPSRWDYNATHPSPPSPLLTLPHPRRLKSLCSHGALKICLRRLPQPSLCLILSVSYHDYASILDP
ncbi:hypothetical protein O181_024310 [Austropuccinia psidii MF-1]|uniref:Uncharacterized protein n=1 Tax=Austropuccinia psidii MF-1 TaxID=1389203 RepID=A0A9Q3CKC1_9BASI|nr:hypothetical protein [Austropuccinia psidii MF-1]